MHIKVVTFLIYNYLYSSYNFFMLTLTAPKKATA
jgi:hypothetical protein